MQVHLAYAVIGKKAPRADGYRIPRIDKRQNERWRDEIKAAMLMMLHTNSRIAAIRALDYHFGDLVSKGELLADVPPQGDIVAHLVSAHPLLLEHKQLYSKAGKHHMFLESRITERVMLEMNAQGIVALPIHDSFLVIHRYAEQLEQCMQHAFETITGVEYGGKVKRKIVDVPCANPDPRMSEFWGTFDVWREAAGP